MLVPWLLGALLSVPVAAPAHHRGEISGVVTNRETGERIAGALVILQCTCLKAPLETQTSAQGLYRFTRLPAGVYTVQVLAGQADVSKVITLPATPPDGEPPARP
ncbi:MAG: carboxypeptidase regulatory-like domain-containing protein [Myxococcales bacterium]|nr:carboxypeptidase regulatory-like domain-containing protein [Myxococcales bacterium]